MCLEGPSYPTIRGRWQSGAGPGRCGRSLYCSASLRPLERFRGLRRMPTLRLQKPAAQAGVADVIQVIAVQETYAPPAHGDGGQSVNEIKGQSVWCHSSSQLSKSLLLSSVFSILTGRWQ